MKRNFKTYTEVYTIIIVLHDFIRFTRVSSVVCSSVNGTFTDKNFRVLVLGMDI